MFYAVHEGRHPTPFTFYNIAPMHCHCEKRSGLASEAGISAISAG